MRVSLHDPDERSLRNLCDARERALGEVAAADEADDLLAAWGAETERMGERQARQRLLVAVDGFVETQVLEVGVERGPVVERVHAVPGACGDEHRLADPPPSVTDADAEWRIGRDPGRDNGVSQHLAGVELECPRHLQIVARASADERHSRAEDLVRAAHDLPLVAREPVAEEQENFVRMPRPLRHTARRSSSRCAQALRRLRRIGRLDDEPVAADRGNDNARVARAGRPDLAGGRASDQRDISGARSDTPQQRRQIVRLGAENHQQLGVVADERLVGRARSRVPPKPIGDPTPNQRAACTGLPSARLPAKLIARNERRGRPRPIITGMTSPASTRVVLADDDVLLREGLASLFARSPSFDVVGQADNPRELLQLVVEHQPDLAIVDIRMPPTHTTEGLDAARTIRHEYPMTAILVLSAHVEVEHAMDLLASGERSGYLLKSRVTDVDEFFESVERIVRGGSVVDPALVQELVAARRVEDPLDVLSPREREVLALMAEGRSNAGIGRELWVTEGTVEKHVHSILSKLRLPESTEAHRRVLAVLTFLEAR